MTTPNAPESAETVAPTCYRHPDRVTYVRCTRCDRPICPEDMIPAAVGFQCPDDVKAGNKGVRMPRTPFGGRAATGDPAIVTKVLLAINALALLASYADDTLRDHFLMDSGVYGNQLLIDGGIATGQWYRLVTAAFLHGSILHLLFNAYALWLFGPPLEAALGRARYLALYLLGAVSGVAASYAFSPLESRSLGASGAVFALFAAHIVVNRRMGRESSGLWALIAVNVALGFILDNVDWRAHAGGFVGGALAAAVIVYAPAAQRTVLQSAGLLALLVAALGLVTWRSVDILSSVGVSTSTSTVVGCEVRHPHNPATYLACVQNGHNGA